MNKEKKIETLYTHDALGNLTEVILPNNDEISYIYDGRNRLISKQVNGIVEYRLIYAGQLAPVAKVDGSGNTIENYIYGLGVNSPDYILKDGTKYRVIKDYLGSIRMIVNSSTGEIVKTLRYSEFGEITEETGTFDTIFGFAGGIRDTDTALTKFGARWYDSTTGRWLEKEPLGFNGSDNFYSYCDGDPVNFVDVTGLKKMKKISQDYDSANSAKAAAAAEFNNPSNNTKSWEYAVSVFLKGDGKYYYIVTTDENPDHVDAWIDKNIVWVYHNHTDGSDDFSDGTNGSKCSKDKELYEKLKKYKNFEDMYLVRANDILSFKDLVEPKKFDPIPDIF